METADPQLFPETGIWHPMAPTFYEDLKEYLNWCVSKLGVICSCTVGFRGSDLNRCCMFSVLC